MIFDLEWTTYLYILAGLALFIYWNLWRVEYFGFMDIRHKTF